MASFLQAYQDWAKLATDAPFIFHEVLALQALGTAVGNRWKMRHFSGWLTPHLWVLLLADSSTFHKSEALKVSRRVLSTLPDILLPWKGSAEKLSETYSKQPWGIMYAPEFEAFLAHLRRDYSGGAGFYLNIFDGEIMAEAFQRGSVKARDDLAISFAAASTTSQLATTMKERDLSAGLLPRFILVHAEIQEQQFALQTYDGAAFDRQLDGLNDAMRFFSGLPNQIMSLSPSAQKLYIAWYQKIAQTNLDGTRADPWKARLATVCLKLSMIYQLDHEIKTQIGPAAVEKACAMTSRLLEQVGHICQEELTFSWFDQQVRVIRRLLQKYRDHEGWVDYKLLLKGSHLKAREFSEILGTLMEREDVEVERGKGRGTRPRQRVRLAVREPGEDDR